MHVCILRMYIYNIRYAEHVQKRIIMNPSSYPLIFTRDHASWLCLLKENLKHKKTCQFLASKPMLFAGAALFHAIDECCGGLLRALELHQDLSEDFFCKTHQFDFWRWQAYSRTIWGRLLVIRDSYLIVGILRGYTAIYVPCLCWPVRI